MNIIITRHRQKVHRWRRRDRSRRDSSVVSGDLRGTAFNQKFICVGLFTTRCQVRAALQRETEKKMWEEKQAGKVKIKVTQSAEVCRVQMRLRHVFYRDANNEQAVSPTHILPSVHGALISTGQLLQARFFVLVFFYYFFNDGKDRTDNRLSHMIQTHITTLVPE